MNWYVLYTRSRCEKTVAEKLALSGIEVYCPMLRRKKLWSDRWKWIEEPLFRSYCFVCLDSLDRDRVFSVSGVVRYVFHCGKPAIVRISEIKLLKDWLRQYDHEYIVCDALNVNDRVMIKSGAFLHKHANVVEHKGNYATLYLEDLSVKVRVDLRTNLLEKLNGR